jgi:hypothetical protein
MVKDIAASEVAKLARRFSCVRLVTSYDAAHPATDDSAEEQAQEEQSDGGASRFEPFRSDRDSISSKLTVPRLLRADDGVMARSRTPIDTETAKARQA